MEITKKWVRNLVQASGFDRSLVQKYIFKKRKNIHFLHVGKNAGNKIGIIAKQVNQLSKTKQIIKHGHEVRLKHLLPNDEYFFSIRNPISRFRSGFYSRMRKGVPGKYMEWSRHDAQAFNSFEHANELAESIFEPGKLGEEAWAAMKSLRHLSQNQSDWFDRRGNFLLVQPPVWIIRQEKFEEDLVSFLASAELGIELGGFRASLDMGTVHANDYSGLPTLSAKAIQNLERWYVQDFLFYDLCENWINLR